MQSAIIKQSYHFVQTGPSVDFGKVLKSNNNLTVWKFTEMHRFGVWLILVGDFFVCLQNIYNNVLIKINKQINEQNEEKEPDLCKFDH